MLGGWAQVKTALARTVQTTEAEGMEIAVLVHLAALGVIIVGRDKAVAPTEAVAQGIAEVRQARAQVRQARGVAQAASAILVTVQAPGQEVVGIPPEARAQVRQARGVAQAASGILVTVQAPRREVVIMAAPAQEVVGIPPVVLARVAAQAQAELEALAAVLAEADQVVALGVGTREAELLLEEALRETTEAQADLTGAETDREAAPTEAAPTEGAVASQTTALTATARTESKALIVSYKLTNHGRYAPMVENEHDYILGSGQGNGGGSGHGDRSR